jgi:membrane protein
MLETFKKIGDLWGKAGVGSHAAATAYYAIFSLAPLVLIAITMAGLFLGHEAAQTAVLDQFGTTFGQDFRGFAEGLISAREETPGIIATIIGAVLILFGASGIFGALREGLDEIFEHLPPDKKPGFLSGIVDQLISIGMVLSLGFLLLASLLLSTILVFVGDTLRALMPGADFLAAIVDFAVSYLLISGFLSLLIGFLPSKRVGRRPALAGGFIAGALFVAGKYAITAYFTLAQPESAFGAASAMVVVVLWAYYLALGLFVSAILARVFFVPREATETHIKGEDMPSFTSLAER